MAKISIQMLDDIREERFRVLHPGRRYMDLTIDEVKELAGRDDPDGLYALVMAYLYGWDIED